MSRKEKVGKVNKEEVRNGKRRWIFLWRKKEKKEKGFGEEGEKAFFEKAFCSAEGGDNKVIVILRRSRRISNEILWSKLRPQDDREDDREMVVIKKRVKRVKKVKRGTLGKGVVFLGLVAAIFLTGKIIFSYRQRVWQKGRFNFVIVSQPVLVISLSPEEKNLTVVLIPSDTYMEVTRGFGLYKIESVYGLGELEGIGGQLLAETVQEFLGVPIEGYINLSYTLHKEEIIDLKRKVTSWAIFLRPQKVVHFFKKELETNLTYWDLFKIWLSAKKVSPGRVNFFNLEKRGVLEDFSLPDGSHGKKGVPMLIDNLLEDFFFERAIRQEKMTIEVFNSTNSPSLGEKAARIITNLGGRVDKVATSEEELTRCELQADEKALRSLIIYRINKIFDCQIFPKKEEGITLILGQDYQRKLFSREGK